MEKRKSKNKITEEDLQLCLQAAENGDIEAQFLAGYCYFFGFYIRKDRRWAVKWWQKAAEKGNSDAQFWLGTCYECGIGVPINLPMAIKWLRKAADQGNEKAMMSITTSYLFGEQGGLKIFITKEEALKYCQKTAKHGNTFSKNLLKNNWFEKR